MARWGIELVGENKFARGIHVVMAMKDGVTEYWAVATHRDDAIAAIRSQVHPDWILVLTERRLTREQVVELKLRHNSVRKLEAPPLQ
jgi:hypothetical protein